MSRFPSEHHLASWAKICPGNNESAGKHRRASTGHGNKWLRSCLTEAAKAAARKNGCYLQAQSRHLKPRLGANKATIAVAHSILTIAYHLLRDGGVYQDLGPNHFDELARSRVQKRLVKRLEDIGFHVTLTDQRVA